MNDSPLFSIMIANHNDGKYIQEALASVEKQTYKNYEVVIVDDGSDDDSNNILKELESKSNYRVYYNDKNYGCGYTKRKCVELAKGELCGFLDADDALTNEALEVMVEKHLKHPDASLIYSRYHYCDKDLTSTMFGMKRIGDDVFIFITYHKVGAESEELQYAEGKPDYADAFADNMTFRWDSQIGRGPDDYQ